jgi:hypothetical protein
MVCLLFYYGKDADPGIAEVEDTKKRLEGLKIVSIAN